MDSKKSFNNLEKAPDNYLTWAILATIFCCLPFGIVSIIKALNVNAYWAEGKFNEAIKASNNAKKFAIISAILGLVVYSVIVILFF